MNPTSGAQPLRAPARSDDAIDAIPRGMPWPGLASAADQIGAALDDIALERFARYRDLLLQRNAQMNLTAIRDPDGIERSLFLDALAMAPTVEGIRRRQGDASQQAIRLIDIGSGGGFPGLPLKIACPDLDVTLVDATGKKATFLNEVIALLALDGARAIHGRAEVLGQDHDLRGQFDIATARAVAELPVLLEYVIPLLVVGGTALLPKGLEISRELRDGRRAAAQLGAEIISADRLTTGATRLIVAGKVKPTPAMYPRRTGIPRQSPLGQGSH